MAGPYNIAVTDTPTVVYNVPGSGTFTALTTPSGVSKVSSRPTKVEYKQRHYFAGRFSKNLVFIESNTTLVIAGITAPASAPTIAIGAAGSPTGVMLGYISFRHKIGTTVVHESNLSAATNSITVSSEKVEWSSIPATSPDARATHVVLYRSVDGADPREVTEFALGTTTYSDNIATSALGAVGPTLNGVPPQSRFVALYHDRAWWVSVDNPERTYFSEIGQPEAVGSASYIATRDAEVVTGIARVLDQLAIFGRRCTYDIQGYTVDDFNMRKVHPSVGCISHHAIVNIDERLFFPAEDGVWIYDGAGFTYTMDDLRTYWRTDFSASVARYNDLIASADRALHVYRLLLKKSTSPKSFYYIGHYLGIDGGKPLRWTFDVRAREDNSVGEMDTGSGMLKSYTGSCDGYVREDNVDSDADDDDDTYGKALTLTLRTDLFKDIGGGSLQAKTFTDLNVYMKAELNAWTIGLYSGEEDATDALSATQSITVSASAATGQGQTFTAKNQHYFRLIGVSGDALAPKFTASSPLSMKFRGWDVYWREGPGTRSRQS